MWFSHGRPCNHHNPQTAGRVPDRFPGFDGTSADQWNPAPNRSAASSGGGGPARQLVEFARHRLDIGQRRQAGFVAEMLDFVRRGTPRELKMLVPTTPRIFEIGIHVSAVEHVAGA